MPAGGLLKGAPSGILSPPAAICNALIKGVVYIDAVATVTRYNDNQV